MQEDTQYIGAGTSITDSLPTQQTCGDHQRSVPPRKFIKSTVLPVRPPTAIANRALLFIFRHSWLLSQSVKDTLCGTKVFSKRDYEMIAANRAYFGEIDPFGDFDLIFGAAKYNLKLVDLPVRYRERIYGETNIQRWTHGWLLLRMLALAMRRIKFI